MRSKHKRLVTLSMALAVALTVGTGPVCLAKGKKPLKIHEPVRLGDTVLKPGDYRVDVVENGERSEVSIYKGKTLVAKAQVQAAELETKATRNSIRYSKGGDDVGTITQLQLAGESVTYRVMETPQQATSGSTKNPS
ncbi:MAG: hypothetical protein AB1898_02090 [Acidobacteriota bacterium]